MTLASTLSRTTKTALPALALLLALTACGTDAAETSGSAAGGAGGHGGGHSSSDTKDGQATDVAFLTGMTPHHEQAVEMSEIVLAADPPAPVAALAERIKAAQEPEVVEMERMLATMGESAGGGHGGGHGGGGGKAHGGMMSDADLAALRTARGTDAARLYLEAMIAHHEGAIEASDAQIADGTYRPAVELAQKIKAAQTAEIAEMRTLLASL